MWQFLDDCSRATALALGLSKTLLGLFWLLLFVCLILLMGRVAFKRWTVFAGRNVREDEAKILSFLETANTDLVKDLSRNRMLRDTIVRLTSTVNGDLQGPPAMLYANLGYYMKDAMALKSNSMRVKIRALDRCRLMRIPMPDEAWTFLMSTKDPNFRWATLDYMIATRGKACVPWLETYVMNENRPEKGHVVQLLGHLASRFPESLVALLETHEDIFLIECILLVLANQPCSGAQRVIGRAIRLHPNLMASGLKAAVVHPSPETLQVVLNARHHPEAEIRTIVASVLEHFMGGEASHALGELTLDSNYFVRERAVESLVRRLDGPEAINAAMLAEPEHPAHGIYQRVRRRESGTGKRSA